MIDDPVQTEYDKYVRKFCQKFEDGIKIADDINDTKTGYVFMFMREMDAGCVDIASNLTSESIINILKMALSNTEDALESSLKEFDEKH